MALGYVTYTYMALGSIENLITGKKKGSPKKIHFSFLIPSSSLSALFLSIGYKYLLLLYYVFYYVLISLQLF